MSSRASRTRSRYIVALKFEWDPQKAARNLEEHAVSFEEARHSVGEERFVLLGLSRRQRLLAVMFAERGEQFGLSAHGGRHPASGENMKRGHRKGKDASRVDLDEILPEYDFSRSRPNKYAARYAGGKHCCCAGA